MEEKLQIINYVEAGFKPVMAFGDWRLAGFNYSADSDVSMPKYKIERHLETDEVFILTEGRAWLLICSSGANLESCETVSMQKGVIYNVRLGTWHGTIMAPGTRIILVEKRDTGSGKDTEVVWMESEEREQVRARIMADMGT